MTVGIDEVGRGCWAGPLVAAAVILDGPIAGLEDSKKLSKSQRQKLAKLIHEQAIAVGVGWVWPEAIDNGGITAAVKSAMQQAIDAIQVPYDEVIIDGHINFLPDCAGSQAVIKADDTVMAVSAASIVAKVARDTYMENLPEQYAKFSFANHVGYGTSAHIKELAEHGVTDIHRKSFKPINKMLAA